MSKLIRTYYSLSIPADATDDKKYRIVERCEVEYYYIVENATSKDDAFNQHAVGDSYKHGQSFVEVLETLIDEEFGIDDADALTLIQSKKEGI